MMRLAMFLVAMALGLVGLGGAAWAEGPARPEIAGEWRSLFQPERAGRYINDHCVYQDPKGAWHLVGITGQRAWFGQNETFFAHGVTDALDQPMAELDPLFDGYPDDRLKWAPHAVWSGDTLHLFAGPGPISHFVSTDGANFEYVGDAISNHWKWLRDTMVIKLGERWVMYATDLVAKQDVVSAFVSEDLYSWDYLGVVFTALAPAEVWAPLPNSACESPFVIPHDGGYYLSLTLTNYPINPRRYIYNNTLVFFSPDPLDFGVYAPGKPANTASLITKFEAHAPEYLQDPTGQWWITTAGWTDWPRPQGCPGGQVCVAPLEWKE